MRALTAASTGPLPVAAASKSSLATRSVMAAIGFTPLPQVTCRASSFTRFSLEFEDTPASTRRSSSPSCFFLSAISRNFLYIVSSCSWSRSMPRMCRRCFSAARPERAVSTIAFSSMPTSFGSIISYVLAFLSTPSWCMPLECAKAFLPTMALLGCTGMFISVDTMRLVGHIFCVLMFVSMPRSGCVLNIMAISSREVLPARSPIPLMVTST